MQAWRLLTGLLVAVTVQQGLQPVAVEGQDPWAYPLEARVWLDRGDEPVMRRGDRARIYYRVSESAFVAVFQIDTNGTARMIFPSSPRENHFARGDRDYRILFPGSSYWYVDDDPGMGYFFIVASPVPFDFSQFGTSWHTGAWDLSYVGGQVYGDPYLAMDEYVAALIPDWEYVTYGLDFTAYHVDRRYEYPRFLCYDCHGFRPYQAWNPYAYSCMSFRVVIYNDPYYYPATRYRGTRVVYVQPRRGVAQFAFKERAAGEPGTPQVVVRNTPPVRQPGVEGGEVRRAVPRTGASAVTSSGGAGQTTTVPPGLARPGVEGTSNRRPAGTAPIGATPPTRPTEVLTGRPGAGAAGRAVPPRVTTPPQTGTSGRPVLERRPPATGTTTPPASTTPPVTRPPTGGGGSGTTVTRPPTGGGGSGTTVTRPPTGGGGSGTTVTRPPTGGGGSGTTVTRPPTGGGGSGTTVTRPPTGGGGSGTTVTRPPTGGGGSGTTVTRPPTGGGGSGTTVTRPPTGGGGSGTTVTRPPTGGGGSGTTVTRPPTGGGGSGTTVTRPPTSSGGSRATVTRPPTSSGGSRATVTRPPTSSGGSRAR
jgi:hypothetical protein